jgi:PncC family amidohydrolase
MADDLAQRVAVALTARAETLAVAESATGGLIASLLTDVPGASAWLRGGIVAYTNDAKRDVLGVPPDILTAHGAVSAETARAMAQSTRRVFGATWGVGETGVAGPQTGRRSSKPAGLTYVAVAGGPAAAPVDLARRYLIEPPGDRVAVKRAFAEATLLLLIETLQQQAAPQQ